MKISARCLYDVMRRINQEGETIDIYRMAGHSVGLV